MNLKPAKPNEHACQQVNLKPASQTSTLRQRVNLGAARSFLSSVELFSDILKTAAKNRFSRPKRIVERSTSPHRPSAVATTALSPENERIMLAEFDWSLLTEPTAIPVIAVGGTFIWLTVASLSDAVARVMCRRADVELKQDLVARGFNSEEIVRISEAGREPVGESVPA